MLYIENKISYYKNNSSVILIECNEMNWKSLDVNVLCISTLLNKMGWYLGAIVNIHNDKCLIYKFAGKVENGTPIIFNKTLYNYWYKELRNNF